MPPPLQRGPSRSGKREQKSSSPPPRFDAFVLFSTTDSGWPQRGGLPPHLLPLASTGCLLLVGVERRACSEYLGLVPRLRFFLKTVGSFCTQIDISALKSVSRPTPLGLTVRQSAFGSTEGGAPSWGRRQVAQRRRGNQLAERKRGGVTAHKLTALCVSSVATAPPFLSTHTHIHTHSGAALSSQRDRLELCFKGQSAY